MSEKHPRRDEIEPFRAGSMFWDLYIFTQGGGVRRTAISSNLWAYAVWLMQPHTDIEPEFFDEAACREADRNHCGYAEALMVVIDRLMNESMSAKFIAAYDNKADFEKRKRAFLQVQKQREEVWHEDNNEWRTDLPPDLS